MVYRSVAWVVLAEQNGLSVQMKDTERLREYLVADCSD
jgi:hypothetical protein